MMDIRIDGLHEKVLLRLMERNNEKTGVGMARILIREAAKDAGIWPTENGHTGIAPVDTEATSVAQIEPAVAL